MISFNTSHGYFKVDNPNKNTNNEYILNEKMLPIKKRKVVQVESDYSFDAPISPKSTIKFTDFKRIEVNENAFNLISHHNDKQSCDQTCLTISKCSTQTQPDSFCHMADNGGERQPIAGKYRSSHSINPIKIDDPQLLGMTSQSTAESTASSPDNFNISLTDNQTTINEKRTVLSGSILPCLHEYGHKDKPTHQGDVNIGWNTNDATSIALTIDINNQSMDNAKHHVKKIRSKLYHLTSDDKKERRRNLNATYHRIRRQKKKRN